MVRLTFKIDDAAIRAATLEAAAQMDLTISHLDAGEFVVAMDDATTAYHFGVRTMTIRSIAILKEVSRDATR